METEPLPTKVIGYEEQRKRLDVALASGAKFILVEGELGSGKTTIMREAMQKYPGFRVIGGTRAGLERKVRTHLFQEGLLGRILTVIRGERPFDVFEFLAAQNEKTVLYLDENHNLESIVLDVKNVVSDNPKLQAVVALTPTQKKLLEKYPEVAKRFSAQAHILLPGLQEAEKEEFIKLYASLPFSEQARRYVMRKDYPQELLDEIRSLEILARENGSPSVEASLVRDYKEPTSVVAQNVEKVREPSLDSGLSPLARQVLEFVEKNKEQGADAQAIAKALGKTPESIYVRINELKKAKLVFKDGRKFYPYFPKKPEGLGA